MAFVSRGNSGFQIKFSNSYIISCRFSRHSYCERYDPYSRTRESEEADQSVHDVKSEDCEVAILNTKDGEFITEKILEEMGSDLITDGAGVIGHVSADDVGKIISYLVNLKD